MSVRVSPKITCDDCGASRSGGWQSVESLLQRAEASGWWTTRTIDRDVCGTCTMKYVRAGLTRGPENPEVSE